MYLSASYVDRLSRALMFGMFGCAMLAIVLPVPLYGHYALPPIAFAGCFIFVGWSLACILTAVRRHGVAWATLCVGPLLFFAETWLSVIDPANDLLRLRWPVIASFNGACLVTAITAAIFVAVVSLSSSPNIRTNA